MVGKIHLVGASGATVAQHKPGTVCPFSSVGIPIQNGAGIGNFAFPCMKEQCMLYHDNTCLLREYLLNAVVKPEQK